MYSILINWQYGIKLKDEFLGYVVKIAGLENRVVFIQVVYFRKGLSVLWTVGRGSSGFFPLRLFPSHLKQYNLCIGWRVLWKVFVLIFTLIWSLKLNDVFMQQANPDPNTCLGVFGLSLYTTERDLREVFSRYGPLSGVNVVYDQRTGRSRGFAFVYFERIDDSKEVILFL